MQINAQDLVEVLKGSKNIILHGAPGTGKTHLAKQIAEELGAEYEFVQFHPSYDYTDFVEGLRPVNENGQVVFKRKDGIFKEFCKNSVVYYEDTLEKTMKNCHDYFARKFSTYNFFGSYNASGRTGFCANYNGYLWIEKEKNYYAETKDIINFMIDIYKQNSIDIKNQKIQYDIAKTIYNHCFRKIFIIDEINRGEISKIFGELFYLIDPDKRGKEHSAKTQYQNLLEDEDAFKDGFYIPDNVYIIATMNDIDRSAEPIDFAFRRRFTWINVKASDTEDIILNQLDEKLKEKAKIKMKNLNQAIIAIDGLDENYQIGASYFLKLLNYLTDEIDEVNEYKKEFNCLWEYHLEPLLREYLSGRAGQEIENELRKLKNEYDSQEVKNNNG